MLPCMERVIDERFGLIGECGIHKAYHSLYKNVISIAVMKLDYRCANSFNTAGVQMEFGRTSSGQLKWQQMNFIYEPSVEFVRDWTLESHFTAAFENWWDSVVCVLQSRVLSAEFANAIKAELVQKVICKEQKQNQLVGE